MKDKKISLIDTSVKTIKVRQFYKLYADNFHKTFTLINNGELITYRFNKIKKVKDVQIYFPLLNILGCFKTDNLFGYYFFRREAPG